MLDKYPFFADWCIVCVCQQFIFVNDEVAGLCGYKHCWLSFLSCKFVGTSEPELLTLYLHTLHILSSDSPRRAVSCQTGSGQTRKLCYCKDDCTIALYKQAW